MSISISLVVIRVSESRDITNSEEEDDHDTQDDPGHWGEVPSCNTSSLRSMQQHLHI